MNSVSIELDFRGEGVEGRYGFQLSAVTKHKFRVMHERCIIRTDSGAELANFDVLRGQLLRASEPVMPPASDQRLFLVAAAGIDAFRPVFDGLAGISVFNVNPDAMRQPQTPDTGEFLRRDGSNVASVLHRLEHTEQGRADKARVESYVRLIVPGMNGVARDEIGNWETLEFAHNATGAESPWRFPAQSVSDGTLRALGVLVSLFAASGDTFSPVGIEEPESALHPAAAGVLLDALRDASERRQVIVTSDSPDLLDRHDFAFSQLRAVRLVAGETTIGPLDKAGALAMREHLYTPGELLRTDQLLPEISGERPAPSPVRRG
jgi:hypothetical protein